MTITDNNKPIIAISLRDSGIDKFDFKNLMITLSVITVIQSIRNKNKLY
jgi:hypothetical protein